MGSATAGTFQAETTSAMQEISASRTVVVTNREGLHLRAAMLVAQKVQGSQSRVVVVKGDRRVKATDVLDLVSLGAAAGCSLLLEAIGCDAEATLDAIAQLFATSFGEEPENNSSQPDRGAW